MGWPNPTFAKKQSKKTNTRKYWVPLHPQILITANNGNKRKWKNTISTAFSRLIFLDSRPGSLTCYCSLDINLCATLRH